MSLELYPAEMWNIILPFAIILNAGCTQKGRNAHTERLLAVVHMMYNANLTLWGPQTVYEESTRGKRGP